MLASLRNLVLIGPTGAGKTTVGEIVAARIGWRWFDVDQKLEAIVGSIPAYIARHGAASFRHLERQLFLQEMPRAHAVIAAGAGSVLEPQSRALLLAHAVVCFLDAPAEVLHARLMRVAPELQHRPDLCRPDALEAVRAELGWRRPLYERLGIRIDAALSPALVAEQVIAVLREKIEQG